MTTEYDAAERSYKIKIGKARAAIRKAVKLDAKVAAMQHLRHVEAQQRAHRVNRFSYAEAA